MANVVFYRAVNMNAIFAYGDSDEILSATPTEIRVGTPGDYYDRYLGTNFSGSGGAVTGGVVNKFIAYADLGVTPIAQISGVSLSAATVYQYLVDDQIDAVKAYVLAGNDSMKGSAGADVIYSYTGSDTIDGGAGADTMVGGNGSDTYYVRDSGDRVVESTSSLALGGKDTVLSYLASHTLATNVEVGKIMLGGTAALTGNALANTLYAGNGNNVINGGTGIDTVDYSRAPAGVTVSLAVTVGQATGGSGTDRLASVENLTGTVYADVLTGNSGNNTLIANAGRDLLAGGAGRDLLVGGTGPDTFRFNTAPNATTNLDRIGDFRAVDDTIQLENAVFTKLAVRGTLAAVNFRANASGTAVDGNDYVVYETDTGKLFYDADGNGAGAAVQIAALAAAPVVSNLDIFVT